jgi:hypothetical protein
VVQAQQGRAPAGGAGIRVSATDDPAELEADRVADRIGDPRAPEAVMAELGPGRPLDGDSASRLGAAMEDDFGDVRIHTDGAATRKAAELDACAFTVGGHVAFAAGEYRPGTPEGDALLAHELAHVQQQRAAAKAPVSKRRDEAAPDEAHEADADGAAAGVLARLYGAGAELERAPRAETVRTRATVASGYALQRKDGKEDAGVKAQAREDTPLVAEIKKALAAKDLAGVFRKLRDSRPTPEEQQEILKALEAAAPAFSNDDLWLAKRLLAGNAADPKAAPTDDSRMFTDPDPDPGTKSPIQTEVHFVAGRSSRRALVIGGVHGSEPEGEVVVRQLIEALKKARTKPFFTVVLIPRLIDRSRQDPKPKSRNAAYREVADQTAKGSAGDSSKGTGSEGNIEVEPNRNFPLPGTSYSSYKKKGHLEFWDGKKKEVRAPKDIVTIEGKGKGTKENRSKAVASEKMLPENRLLVHLIERFQPERLVSVHQHRVSGSRGNGAGVFVDPRRPATKRSADDGFDSKSDQALTPEGQQDDKLAVAMRDSIQKGAEVNGLRKKDTDPLAGNDVPLPGAKRTNSPTVHYKTEAHGEGNSLGDYAPVEVKEGGAWDRPAIGTITIEIPQYDKTKKDQAADLAKLEAIEVATLQSIFLEDPTKATP